MPSQRTSQLQVAVTDLASAYLDALKDVQNEVERLHQAGQLNAANGGDPPKDGTLTELASLLADRVVGLHVEIDGQTEALQRAYRSETDQLHALQKLQAEHTAVASELQAEVHVAEVLHEGVRTSLDAVFDGIHDLNANK